MDATTFLLAVLAVAVAANTFLSLFLLWETRRRKGAVPLTTNQEQNHGRSSPVLLSSPVLANDLIVHGEGDEVASEDTSDDTNASAPATIFSGSQLVSINVGGTTFVTTLSTLSSDPSTYFARRLQFEESDFGSSSGGIAMFVDRDPTHFNHILNYLRSSLPPPLSERSTPHFLSSLLAEADFYSISGLAEALTAQMERLKEGESREHSTEREWKLVRVKSADVDKKFKEWVSEGFELSNMIPMPPSAGEAIRRHSTTGSPLSPRRRDNIAASEDVTEWYMVWVKSLTKADVNFFDRLMARSN